MTKLNIDELFEKIKECIEFYESTYIENKIFTLHLGNGEKVKYTITKWNIPHLLGINLDPIKNINKYKNKDSYELLKEICENPFQLNRALVSGIIKEEQIFSKFIDKKIENFKENFKSDAKVIIDETEFVCSYKSKNSWEVTTKNQKYDYIIVKRYNNGKIGLLCLVKNEMQYYAMSNQLFDSIEEANKSLSELITNQEITLVDGFDIYNKYTDNNFHVYLSINQKLDKVDNLRFYKNKFDCYVDISEDYQYTIKKLKGNKNEKITNDSITSDIVEAITNHELIPRESYLYSSLISIIDAWNDHVCMTPNPSTNIQKSYTEIKLELKTLKQLVKKLEIENNDLKTQVNDLKDENSFLLESNTEQKEIINKVYQLTKPREK